MKHTFPLPLHGLGALSTTELVGLVFGPKAAAKLAEHFPTPAQLLEAEVADLAAHVTPRAATAIAAALELGRRAASTPLIRGQRLSSSDAVVDHYGPLLKREKKEHFYALLLNRQNRLLSSHLIAVGTLDFAPVHPREVLGPAVRESAASIILAHNHPSGDPDPSQADFAITRRLRDAGDLLGIQILDHVILGDECHHSMAAEPTWGKKTWPLIARVAQNP